MLVLAKLTRIYASSDDQFNWCMLTRTHASHARYSVLTKKVDLPEEYFQLAYSWLFLSDSYQQITEDQQWRKISISGRKHLSFLVYWRSIVRATSKIVWYWQFQSINIIPRYQGFIQSANHVIQGIRLYNILLVTFCYSYFLSHSWLIVTFGW